MIFLESIISFVSLNIYIDMEKYGFFNYFFIKRDYEEGLHFEKRFEERFRLVWKDKNNYKYDNFVKDIIEGCYDSFVKYSEEDCKEIKKRIRYFKKYFNNNMIVAKNEFSKYGIGSSYNELLRDDYKGNDIGYIESRYLVYFKDYASSFYCVEYLKLKALIEIRFYIDFEREEINSKKLIFITIITREMNFLKGSGIYYRKLFIDNKRFYSDKGIFYFNNRDFYFNNNRDVDRLKGIFEDNTNVLSVLFSKDKYDLSFARDWLKRNRFKFSKVDKKGNYYRFRQKDYKKYNKIRTKEIKDGIKILIGFKE